MDIRRFRLSDQDSVIRIWEDCGLTRPWNDPRKDIARKLSEQPELFLVGVCGGAIVGTAMAGFDGHRGWIYYVAVAPAHQGRGYGRRLMQEAERLLQQRGCPKLNLQVRASNIGALDFYRKLGYLQDDVICLGRRLIED
jgi:ribosomal protein S18 acetylase RimI-like enzyme